LQADAVRVASIGPPGPSKRFIVRFSGAVGLQQQRCAAAFEAMRVDGTWVECTARSTSGAGTRVYVEHDKNGHSLKVESSARRLTKILATLHPGIAFRARKEDGRVYIDGTLLARVTADPANVDVVFNQELVAAKGIRHEAALERLNHDPEGDITWV